MKYLILLLSLAFFSCHNRTLVYEENYIEQEGSFQYHRVIIQTDTIK